MNTLYCAIFLVASVYATITDDFSCSSDNVYLNTATACSNNYPDAVCEQFYPETSPGAGYPGALNAVRRPFKCTGDTEPKPEMKEMAIQNCPKTCGFCCLTPAYNCSNALFPRLDCKSVTPEMCQDPIWRQLIAEDCPSACGFCGLNGCVDVLPNCDKTMCSVPSTQSQCKRTCSKCPIQPILIGDPCIPGPDTGSNCAAWAANGFCTSEFYTHAQRKQYCSTTCKIC